MLNLLSNLVNHSLEAATAHAQAIQRKDQTVRSFATYLNVLEDQLTPYTKEQRVQHLFSKLRPKLQRAITNYHQVPTIREDLISLGSTLKRNLRRAPIALEPRTRHASKTKPQETARNPLTPRGGSKPPNKRKITCFKCQKTGHYANECLSGNPN
jgi:hypothetical protein